MEPKLAEKLNVWYNVIIVWQSECHYFDLQINITHLSIDFSYTFKCIFQHFHDRFYGILLLTYIMSCNFIKIDTRTFLNGCGMDYKHYKPALITM